MVEGDLVEQVTQVNTGNGELPGIDPVVDQVFEKAEQEVMSCLPEMEVSELEALCKELGLEIPPEKKVRRDIYRFVVAYLMQRETDDADQGKAYYIQVHGVLRSMMAPRTDHQQGLDNYSPHFNTGIPDVKAAQVKPAVPHVQALNFDHIKQSSSAGTPLLFPLEEDKAVAKPVPKAPPALFHLKECKIRGTIGDPGEKDKLGYYGLISEIKERSREGYDDNRVVGAVINAITPGNVFKKRLEMRRNLEGSISLTTLFSMLRTHYQEKSSNTIFQELSNAVQSQDETATKYCNRLIVIRDEALSRSIEEGCPLDSSYLKKRFLKSFATGLRNGNIRNELREVLKSEPGDDELLDNIAEATRGEKERSDKMAQIKGVSFSPDVSVVQREKDDFQLGKSTGLAAKIAELQLNHKSEMGSLRAELNEMKNIFKSGFTNLAAVAANSAPSPAVQPSIPATVVTPGLPNNSAYSMCPSTVALQAGLSSSNLTSVSSPQQPQPYVIPQMRRSADDGPQPLMNTLQPAPASLPSLNRRNKRFSGCVACVANNSRCTHCWFCGRGDHKMDGCPTRQLAAANAQARAANVADGSLLGLDGMLSGNG